MEKEHLNVVKHKQRMSKRVDREELKWAKKLAKEYFNPNVN